MGVTRYRTPALRPCAPSLELRQPRNFGIVPRPLFPGHVQRQMQDDSMPRIFPPVVRREGTSGLPLGCNLRLVAISTHPEERRRDIAYSGPAIGCAQLYGNRANVLTRAVPLRHSDRAVSPSGKDCWIAAGLIVVLPAPTYQERYLVGDPLCQRQ